MRKTLLLFLAAFLFISSKNIHAQTIVVPDTLKGWQQTWVANLNGSQASYDNWSEGGVNTLSGTASTIFTNLYRKDQWGYGFRINLRYGQSKINGQDVRKTDDLISIRNRVTYEIEPSSMLKAFGAVQFRTQFADGFEYEKAADGGDSLISSWMAPGYLTEGLGLELTFDENLTLEAGFAAKQTFVAEEALRPVYGLDPDESMRSEGGITLGITYQNTVMDNLIYFSSVETFSNLLYPLSETDVYWSNELKGKINSLISAAFQFELRYDNDFSKDVQLKQVLSAGLSVSIF